MSFDYYLACDECKKVTLLAVQKVHGWYMWDAHPVITFIMAHSHESGGPHVVDEGSSEVLNYADDADEDFENGTETAP